MLEGCKRRSFKSRFEMSYIYQKKKESRNDYEMRWINRQEEKFI